MATRESGPFSFFDIATGDRRAAVEAVEGQLIVRDLATRRVVHTFAVRRKSDGAPLAVRPDDRIGPSSDIFVTDALRVRTGVTGPDDSYTRHTLRFGPLLLAIHQGLEFIDLE